MPIYTFNYERGEALWKVKLAVGVFANLIFVVGLWLNTNISHPLASFKTENAMKMASKSLFS